MSPCRSINGESFAGLICLSAKWFQLVAAATATALSEGRASTITTNIPEVLDCCRHLASHFRASATVEEVECDGLIDFNFRSRRQRHLEQEGQLK